MHLIFDFDGTMVNSFDCVVSKIISMADTFHYRKISPADIEHLRQLNTRELFHFLQIPLLKLPIILHQIRKQLHNEMTSLTPVSGLSPVLEQIYAAGHTLGILTSNSEENVNLWLEHNKLNHLFSFVHFESRLFSKKRLIRRTLKFYKIDKSQAFYIGDETRDIEAAKHNNIYAVAITWGYNSEKALLKCKPHFIAHKPSDILDICNV